MAETRRTATIMIRAVASDNPKIQAKAARKAFVHCREDVKEFFVEISSVMWAKDIISKTIFLKVRDHHDKDALLLAIERRLSLANSCAEFDMILDLLEAEPHRKPAVDRLRDEYQKVLETMKVETAENRRSASIKHASTRDLKLRQRGRQLKRTVGPEFNNLSEEEARVEAFIWIVPVFRLLIVIVAILLSHVTMHGEVVRRNASTTFLKEKYSASNLMLGPSYSIVPYVNLSIFQYPVPDWKARSHEKQQPYNMTSQPVSLDELLNVSTGDRILIVGGPGTGKTRLTLEIMKMWTNNKVLLSCELLFVYRLRWFSLQKKDIDLRSIVSMHMEVVDEIVNKAINTGGKKLCFLFDGLDEYEPGYSDIDNYVFLLMHKQALVNAVVIVTTRNITSTGFEAIKWTRRYHITGFSNEQLKSYFQSYFMQTGKSFTNFVAMHSNLWQMCKIPLHVSLLLNSFGKKTLDTAIFTTTELFEEITVRTFERDLRKANEPRLTIKLDLKLLLEFPVFAKVCALAFKGSLNRQYSFLDSEVPAELKWTNLSYFYVEPQPGAWNMEVYTFIDPILMNFLAAVHLTSLNESEQIRTITEYYWKVDGRVEYIWNFFCGLTSSFKSLMREILDYHHWLGPLRMVHCIFEAQSHSAHVVQSAAQYLMQKEEGILKFMFTTLTVYDMQAIDYFVSCISPGNLKGLVLSSITVADGDYYLSFLLNSLSKSRATLSSLKTSKYHSEVKHHQKVNMFVVKSEVKDEHLLDMQSIPWSVNVFGVISTTIGNEGAVLLANSIKNSKKMIHPDLCGPTILDLRYNNIGGEGLVALISKAALCRRLVLIDLSGNKVTDSDVDNIIKICYKVTVYRLFYTKILLLYNKLTNKGKAKLRHGVSESRCLFLFESDLALFNAYITDMELLNNVTRFNVSTLQKWEHNFDSVVQPNPPYIPSGPFLVTSNHSAWSEFSPEGSDPILWQVFCTEQADVQLTGFWSFLNGHIGLHNSTKESYSYDSGTCTNFSLQLFDVTFAASAGLYTISAELSFSSHSNQTFLLSVSGCPCDDAHLPSPHLRNISVVVSNTSRDISLDIVFMGCANNIYYSVVVEQSTKIVCKDDMPLSDRYKCGRSVSNECLFFQRIVIVDYSPEDSGDYCFSAVSVTGKNSKSCVHIEILPTFVLKFKDQDVHYDEHYQLFIYFSDDDTHRLYALPSIIHQDSRSLWQNNIPLVHSTAWKKRLLFMVSSIMLVMTAVFMTAIARIMVQIIHCRRDIKSDSASSTYHSVMQSSLTHRSQQENNVQVPEAGLPVSCSLLHVAVPELLNVPGNTVLSELPVPVSLLHESTSLSPYFTLSTLNLKGKYILLPSIGSFLPGYMDRLETIVCSNMGGIYHNPLHGITLIIPKGAIPQKSYKITIGVHLYDGNFVFPQGLSPVSALVWLCTEHQMNFLKPIEVFIPHFLECEDNDDAANLNMRFMKASHWDQADGEIQFFPAEGQADFTSLPNKGILHTNHFCYLCIAAPSSPKILQRQMFYLSCAVPRRITSFSDIYFYITYLNNTCYTDMENKLSEGYSVKERRTFKFSGLSLYRYLWFWGVPTITGTCNCSAAGRPVQVTTTLQPAKVTMDKVNFWKLHQEGVLEVLHKNKDYPPYMKLTFGELSLSEELVVTVSFDGIQESTKIEIILPRDDGVRNNQYDSNNMISQPSASDIPRLTQLRILKTRASTSPLRLLEALALQWETLGDTIDFDDIGTNVQLIKRECEREGPVACCRRVFQEWLSGKGGYQPPTWGNLIQLLEDIDQNNLAKALLDSLS